MSDVGPRIQCKDEREIFEKLGAYVSLTWRGFDWCAAGGLTNLFFPYALRIV